MALVIFFVSLTLSMRLLISLVLAILCTTLSGEGFGQECLCQRCDLVAILIAELAGGINAAAKIRGFLLHVLQQLGSGGVHLIHRNGQKQMIQRGNQKDNLLVLAVGMVLGLPQKPHQALAVLELTLGGVIQIAGEPVSYTHLRAHETL